jgi:pSer/pThr/pTyr-binding forkhead associated (FHA) protein
MPQPRVTIVQPATSKQGTPAPAQPPQMTPYTPPATMPVYTSPAQSATPKVQPAQPQKPIQPKPSNQPVLDPNAPWGVLTFSNGTEIRLSGERAVIGRVDHDLGADVNPQVDLSKMQGADTVSRIHAVIEHIGSAYTLTDLNSTNATRINGKRLEPDKATPIQEGETLAFGKVSCTFKKV